MAMGKRLPVIFLIILLTCGPAWAERLAVSAPEANIRSGPDAQHAVIWKAQLHFPMEVLEKSGSWVRFRDSEGDQGWVHASLVRDLPTVITVKDKCQIRSGPEPGSAILFTVGKGIPFRVVSRKGDWINIEHADGDKGWIHRSLVW